MGDTMFANGNDAHLSTFNRGRAKDALLNDKFAAKMTCARFNAKAATDSQGFQIRPL
jgi:hypothetical protein